MKRSNEKRWLAPVVLVSVMSAAASQPVFADAASDLEALRTTTRQLIDALAGKGTISAEDAEILRQAVLPSTESQPASAPANTENAAQESSGDHTQPLAEAEPAATSEDASAEKGSDATTVKDESAKTDAAAQAAPDTGAATQPSKVVRVPYVPDFVREEIRQQVRKDLQDEVVDDVMKRASLEGWGLPGALPAWTRRMALSGDMRLRWESDNFADSNIANSYYDYQKINTKGGISKAGDEAFLNTTKDRKRLRLRLRLGIDAHISDGVSGRVRLSTGSTQVPVSTNQTLGNTANRYALLVDQAFLSYDWKSRKTSWLSPRVTLWGGRMPNPWQSTDVVWDDDVSFEGLAGRMRLGHWGSETDAHRNGVFMTLGLFPLQESERFADKWLSAGQVGTSWRTASNAGVDFSVAYYDFQKVRGEPNDLGSIAKDWTAPQYIQKGNSLIRISNDVGETAADPRLVGLAADFKVVDAVLRADFGAHAPVVLTADYAVNRGFSRDAILARTGSDISSRNKAYSFDVKVGSKKIHHRGEWQANLNWRHVERDAVLDAFTDSDFHLGGTDAQGWWMAGSLGLADDTWLTARWISADEIDGPPLGIDILFLDLNTRF